MSASLFSDPHEAVEWMRQWASTLTYEGDKLREAAGLLEDSYNDFRNEEERADDIEERGAEAAKLVSAYYAYHSEYGEECPCDVCAKARVYFAALCASVRPRTESAT